MHKKEHSRYKYLRRNSNNCGEVGVVYATFLTGIYKLFLNNDFANLSCIIIGYFYMRINSTHFSDDFADFK